MRSMRPVVDGCRRLAQLRASFAARRIDALVVPASDPHVSEYPPAAFQRRSWLSHFDGSAGTAAVTASAAALWTDSRYFIQAAQQLPDGWDLMKEGAVAPSPTPTLGEWLRAQADEAETAEFVVGCDPLVMSQSALARLQKEVHGSTVRVAVLDQPNPVDAVWGSERPPVPHACELRVIHTEFAGKSVGQKISELRSQLAQGSGADLLVVSELDEVMWLTNLRGWGAVPHCQSALCFALVEAKTDGSTTLFIAGGETGAFPYDP